MPGKIKRALESIISQRSKGDATLALLTKTKIVLKGINPDKFDANSPDDPAVMAKVMAIANDLRVAIR
jgi:hypothetical protein